MHRADFSQNPFLKIRKNFQLSVCSTLQVPEQSISIKYYVQQGLHEVESDFRFVQFFCTRCTAKHIFTEPRGIDAVRITKLFFSGSIYNC